MIRSKLSLLGLCAVTLGMMAIGVGAAQASLFTWLVLDEGGTALESLKAELASEKDSQGLTLLTKLLGIKVAITCTTLKLVGVNLEAEGKLTTGGRARFEGCEGYGKGTLEEALVCKVHSAGTGSGIVETGQLKGELVLHELAGGSTELLTKVEPKEGTSLAVVLTEGCILPESNPVHGSLFIKDSEGKAEGHNVKHLIAQGPLTSLYVGAHTTEHLETSTDGSVWVSLAGVHKSLAWAGKHIVEPPLTGLRWLVLNGSGTTATELKAPLVGERDSQDLTLLTKLLGKKLAITCTGFELKGLNLETGGVLTTGFTILYTGCETYGSGSLTEPLGCNVHSSGTVAGSKTIETNKLKGGLVLHTLAGGGSEVLAKIEPETGATFATFLTEECVWPETNPVRGVVYVKDCLGKALTHEVKHLVEQAPLTSLYLGAHSAEHLETSIDGSGWVQMGGAVHLGLKWSAMDT
jgi:hypothetical protein